MGKLIDLTGKRFGRLIVIKRTGIKNKQILWLCKCDCGKEKEISGVSLKRGATVSCGCYRRECELKNLSKNWGKAQITHGLSKTRLYQIWRDMKSRCNNPKNKSYKDYGKRGIKICKEWNESFESANNTITSKEMQYEECIVNEENILEGMNEFQLKDYILEKYDIELYTYEDVRKAIHGANYDGTNGYTDIIVEDYL